MLKVSHLSKGYGEKQIVKDVSFEAQKGKIYGFLGPNGVGKSTTMNMITGYLAPTSGKVLIDGKDVQREPEEAKKKPIVFDEDCPETTPERAIKFRRVNPSRWISG